MDAPRGNWGSGLARRGARGAVLGGVIGLGLLLATPAHTGILCTVLKYCLYEGMPFTIKVVDKETGSPLSDVHALAEWVQQGRFGAGGPVMVQDAVSGPDGILAFPAWGPLRGSPDGLLVYEAPVITLFKPGYLLVPPPGGARAIFSSDADGTLDSTRVWRAKQDGQTFLMERFRGTVEDWVKEAIELAGSAAGGMAPEQERQFHGSYMNRMRRVRAELQRSLTAHNRRLPATAPPATDAIESQIWFFENRFRAHESLQP